MNLLEKVRQAVTSPAAGGNIRLVAEITPTQTVDDWLKSEQQLRSYYSCNRVRINEIDSRHVAVNLFFNDPLTDGMSVETFQELLAQSHSWSDAPFAVDEDGEVKRSDFVHPPHTLIGGATDSGKSSVMGAIMSSLLTSQEGVNFVLLDPKQVELTAWESVSTAHATEPADMVSVLGEVIELMEARFRYMSKVRLPGEEVLGIKTLWSHPLQMEAVGGPVLVVIDELADLLATSGKDAGSLIGRLVQKGRAAGIHGMFATQNPSAAMFAEKVGMNNFKPNVGRRLALKTASQTDSNIILATGTEAPASGANAATIPITLPGCVIDTDGIRFRAPFVSNNLITSLTRGRGRQTFADLMKRTEVELFDFGNSAGGIDVLKSAGPDTTLSE